MHDSTDGAFGGVQVHSWQGTARMPREGEPASPPRCAGAFLPIQDFPRRLRDAAPLIEKQKLWQVKVQVSRTNRFSFSSTFRLSCLCSPEVALGTLLMLCQREVRADLRLSGRICFLGVVVVSEQNKAAVRRYIEEAWNRGKLAMVDEVLAPNYASHDPGNPEYTGREGVKQLITLYRNAFPDLHWSIEDQIAEGDKVVTRWTARGTHKGDLRGIPSTGKQVTVTGTTCSRFAGGKVAESWVNWDTLGLMQQLGAVPSPQRAAR